MLEHHLLQVVVHEGPMAAARLQELGIEKHQIVAAVEAAEIERRSCSSLEPSISAPFKAWAAAFRTIAEYKVKEGWVRTESYGLPRMLNLETAVAIAVVSGDEQTGRRYGSPKSRSPRGPQSVLLVRRNERQLRMPFVENVVRFKPLPLPVEQITWWLLIYSKGDELRAEVSLPVGLDSDWRFSDWQERIIVDLPNFALPPLRSEEDEEPPLEFEIPVRQR